MQSNTSDTPNAQPLVDLTTAVTELKDLATRGKLNILLTPKLGTLSLQATKAVTNRDQAGALSALTQIRTLVLTQPSLDPVASQDLEWMTSKLIRRVTLAPVECTGGSEIGWGQPIG